MLLALILEFSLFPRTLADVHREFGTVVVFLVSTDRVIIAADSRASGDLPNDQACKIAGLGKRLLYAGSGYVADVHTILVSKNWSARREAIRAFSTLQQSKQRDPDIVSQVSNIWLVSMKRIFTQELKSYPHRLLALRKNGALMNAVFIGLDHTGQLEAREIGLAFDTAALQKSNIPKLIVINRLWNITSEETVKISGYATTIENFISQSPKKKKEAEDLWLGRNRHPNDDPEMLYANFLVDWTSLHAPAEAGIGGPVDEVEIIPNIGIRWIQRKPGCPANSASQ